METAKSKRTVVTKQGKVKLPMSLGGHAISSEAIEQIEAHVNRLSETALRVSEELPFGASTGDVFRVLEQE